MRAYIPMLQRICSVMMIAALLTGATGAALGAEGTELPPLSVEETYMAEQQTAPPAAEEGTAVLEQTPAEPEASQQTEPIQEEVPPVVVLPEEATAEPEQTDAYDWDDPLYERYMHAVRTMALFEASFGNYTPRALKSHETLRKGIDVANHQGDIDWSEVATDGVEFAIIRVAWRGSSSGELNPDARYAQNLQNAKAAGLKVGAYVFSQAITVAEAEEEARYLVELCRGYSIDLPLVFDYEFYSNGRLAAATLTRQEKTDICKAFCRVVEAAGYQSMVYSNPSMLSKDLYREQLGRLWLANYADKTSYAGEYEYWQCGYGRVEGIDGDVDLDFWFDPGGHTQAPPVGETVTTPAPEITNPFQDVSADSWYYDSVLQAYGAGIVKGVSDVKFEPGKTATRAQIVTMLYRMAGEPSVASPSKFADLKENYYKDPIAWASAQGIVSGVSETAFSPDGNITREQLVTMLYRQAGSPTTSGSLDQYSDSASVQSYARSAMCWAVERGVINGYTNGTIRPSATATRAEVCAILIRFEALN